MKFHEKSRDLEKSLKKKKKIFKIFFFFFPKKIFQNPKTWMSKVLEVYQVLDPPKNPILDTSST